MIPGAVHRSPGIYLTTEELLANLQLGGHLIKVVRSVIASNGVHYFKMRSVGSHSTSGREKEGNKGRTGLHTSVLPIRIWLLFYRSSSLVLFIYLYYIILYFIFGEPCALPIPRLPQEYCAYSRASDVLLVIFS